MLLLRQNAICELHATTKIVHLMLMTAFWQSIFQRFNFNRTTIIYKNLNATFQDMIFQWNGGFSWVMGMLLICFVNESGWNKLKLKNLLRSCAIFQWNWGVHLFLRSCYLWLLLELTVYSFHTWNLSNSKQDEMFLLFEWGIQLCITGDWYVFVFGISPRPIFRLTIFRLFINCPNPNKRSSILLTSRCEKEIQKAQVERMLKWSISICLIWM